MCVLIENDHSLRIAANAALTVLAGSHERPGVEQHEFVMTAKHEALLADMMRSHAFGDICLLGGRGVGKTAVVNKVRFFKLAMVRF